MSLLSTDITKIKRLSLREVKLPAPDRWETITPIQVDKPPTEEEKAYSRLVTINPLIEELVERLDLVSIKTGEQIKKVEIREEYKPHTEPEHKAQEVDKPKLIALAQRVIEVENSYSREEVVERIKEATNISQDRAEESFTLILKAGALESTSGDRYYLTGSTPF